ncbi:MAG: toxin-antitoxin system YwqK family antitoxin [Helicobacteraceae bacterium]|nr:toxin-antitoxin system YwqK family antitoxin [Helicobacteraceae bacterium]
MKRVLIAILLATICQGADTDYKVYVLGETARLDNGKKCMDMKGNLLSGKAELQKPREDNTTIATLCIDGKAIEERGYDERGGLDYAKPLKNGKAEGVAKRFYRSGKLALESPYKNGKLEGVWRSFYESGKLAQETPYKNDKAEGIAKIFYESGELEQERPFKNGVRDGIVKTYYEDGKLKGEIQYKNGKRERLAKFFYENGELERKIMYKNGAQEGETKVFRENGEIWGVFTYKNDKLVSGVCYKANGEKTPLTKVELEDWRARSKINCE